MRIEYASLTDTGQVRQNNEDSYGEFVPEDAAAFESKGALFVVADGMGGHRGGEIASELAVRVIGDAYDENGSSDPVEVLVSAFGRANEQILAQSVSDSTLFGMGTTCTAMIVRRGRAYFAHIGDSRAYLLRDGEIVQLTQDHSLVGDMVRSGILSDEDARNHPKRNVITRSLGIQESTPIDTPHSPLELSVGDAILLCSDGLTSYVSDDELRDVLASQDPGSACSALVEMANGRGGRDNITVQIVRIASAD
jgi:protein phosphatase